MSDEYNQINKFSLYVTLESNNETIRTLLTNNIRSLRKINATGGPEKPITVSNRTKDNLYIKKSRKRQNNNNNIYCFD